MISNRGFRPLRGAAPQASPMRHSLELSDSYHEAVKIDLYKPAWPYLRPDASGSGPVSSAVREQPSSTHAPFTILRKPVNSVVNASTLVWPRDSEGSDPSRSVHEVQQILKTEETEKPREVDDPQQWPRDRKVLHSIIPAVIAFLT